MAQGGLLDDSQAQNSNSNDAAPAPPDLIKPSDSHPLDIGVNGKPSEDGSDDDKSDMDEGEGKEGDDDMNGLSPSSGIRRKRLNPDAHNDKKRRKFTKESPMAGKGSAKPDASVHSKLPAPISASSLPAPSPDQVRSNSMKDELKCAVCYDFFLGACTLACSHSFCKR